MSAPSDDEPLEADSPTSTIETPPATLDDLFRDLLLTFLYVIPLIGGEAVGVWLSWNAAGRLGVTVFALLVSLAWGAYRVRGGRAPISGWRAKLDLLVLAAGSAIAHLGVVAQFTGFALAWVFADPITGYDLLTYGMLVAGVGGVGIVYGMQVGASGSPTGPGGSLKYNPESRRFAVFFAVFGFPAWAVLSLPIGIVIYGSGILGLLVVGGVQIVRRVLKCLPWA